jgi:hypothetical protein
LADLWLTKDDYAKLSLQNKINYTPSYLVTQLIDGASYSLTYGNVFEWSAFKRAGYSIFDLSNGGLPIKTLLTYGPRILFDAGLKRDQLVNFIGPYVKII